MAHRLTQKEVYLLSGPSELQPVNDHVTQYTPREEDLLQLPDVSEAQKLKSPKQIQQQTRHNYSQLTENEKAKFQNLFTYNDQRNFIKCNPVKKISDDLVYPTKSHTSSDSVFSEEREEIAEDIHAPAKNVPAPARHTGDSRGTTLHSRIKKVNEEELWKASQCI